VRVKGGWALLAYRYVPVPRSSITCGLDEALSLMVIVPDFAPWDCGEKVALMLRVSN
jgi:hypothetical protein